MCDVGQINANKKTLLAKDSKYLEGQYELPNFMISIMKLGSEVKADGFMLVGSRRRVRAKSERKSWQSHPISRESTHW